MPGRERVRRARRTWGRGCKALVATMRTWALTLSDGGILEGCEQRT